MTFFCWRQKGGYLEECWSPLTWNAFVSTIKVNEGLTDFSSKYLHSCLAVETVNDDRIVLGCTL